MSSCFALGSALLCFRAPGMSAGMTRRQADGLCVSRLTLGASMHALLASCRGFWRSFRRCRITWLRPESSREQKPRDSSAGPARGLVLGQPGQPGQPRQPRLPRLTMTLRYPMQSGGPGPNKEEQWGRGPPPLLFFQLSAEIQKGHKPGEYPIPRRSTRTSRALANCRNAAIPRYP